MTPVGYLPSTFRKSPGSMAVFDISSLRFSKVRRNSELCVVTVAALVNLLFESSQYFKKLCSALTAMLMYFYERRP